MPRRPTPGTVPDSDFSQFCGDPIRNLTWFIYVYLAVDFCSSQHCSQDCIVESNNLKLKETPENLKNDDTLPLDCLLSKGERS